MMRDSTSQFDFWYTPTQHKLAENIAKQLNCRAQPIKLHQFPDGETKVSLPAKQSPQLVLLADLSKPNESLIQTMLICKGAYAAGIDNIILVAPYLPYMRQDIAFHPGEVVSQQIIGHFISEITDCLITIDPHLHRISKLEQAIPSTRIATLTAAGTIGQFVSEHYSDAVLIGPDAESLQWVKLAATETGLDYTVATKQRSGDRDVAVTLGKTNLSGKQAIIIDDMCSTGHTLAEAARQATKAGAKEVHAIVTHALMDENTLSMLKSANISSIASSDSLPHSTNSVSTATLLANAINNMSTS
jgi:ribose-phosphate pyrophosphokinase